MAARLVNRIERDLAERGWPDGTQVGTEPELLKKYVVSRAVFREAIRIGEHRGIMRMIRGPRGGLIAGTPTMERVTAACEVHLVLQKVTLREVVATVEVLGPVFGALGAARISDHERNELRRRLTTTAVDGFDPRFRSTIARMPQNPVAEIFSELVGGILERFIASLIAADPANAQLVMLAQRSVLQALVDRDGNAAAAGMIGLAHGLLQLRPELADEPVVTFDEMSEFSHDSKSKLAERTALLIMTDVVNGKLPVGYLMGAEPELMERYGVSRAAFREAVRLVEHHQVARMRRGPGGGLIVTEPRLEPVVQAFATFLDFRGLTPAHLLEIRRPVEKATVAMVVEAAKTDATILPALEAAVARELRADFDVPSELSLHVAIGDRCGARTLSALVRVLAELSDRRLPGERTDDEMANQLRTESEQSHRAIVDAIRAGDTNRAQEAMSEHLRALGPHLR